MLLTLQVNVNVTENYNVQIIHINEGHRRHCLPFQVYALLSTATFTTTASADPHSFSHERHTIVFLGILSEIVLIKRLFQIVCDDIHGSRPFN